VTGLRLREAFDREVAAGFRGHAPGEDPVTAADCATLPAAVQNYLRFAGVLGAPRVWNYRVRFGGWLRNGKRWMNVTADQQSFVEPAARLMLIDASLFGLSVLAFHRYVGSTATFEVRVASLFKVVDARGPEMNRSETVTLLNDMCLLAPATLIDPRLVWEELDERSVRVSFTNAGNAVSAILVFAPSGALAGFVSEDRYRTANGKRYERLLWSTPVREWRSFGDRLLPAFAEAAWVVEGREEPYARFEVVNVEYNARGPRGSTAWRLVGAARSRGTGT
jgi:hypothetical protein